MKETITSKLTEFLSLCKNHKVKTIYAFGSATNDSFKEETIEIDLLIELRAKN